MPLSQVHTAVAAAVGVAGGGASTVWVAKLLVKRMIEQYDKRHEAHDTHLSQLAGEIRNGLADMRAKLAAIEVRASEVSSMRGDITMLVRDSAVNEALLKKVQTDVNEVWRRVKVRVVNEGKT